MDGFLFQAFVYLCAAVIAVPIARRLGLGSVLGYLVAGLIIGPLFGLVGSETADLQHFAEFGVVMMLFLVGLELEPKALWEMRGRLLGLGGLQVTLTAALVTGMALLLGQPWQFALATGFVLSLSSTAIVLQTLNEKQLMRSEGGRASFSVLLFQDIVVIPMLAVIPLLALPELAGPFGGAAEAEAALNAGAGADIHAGTGADTHAGTTSPDESSETGSVAAATDGHGDGFDPMASLPGWQIALVNLGAIALVIGGGQYLSRPLFRYVARSHLRELFTATALLLVVGIAALMSLVGLSPALGTFLAGVVLANSEYRHELESNIEPFKGLLLGLFFITVGAGIDVEVLFASVGTIVGLTVGLIAIKVAVLTGLSFAFGVGGHDRWLFALATAQAGEFGFVLISFCLQNAALSNELADLLLLVVALSMLLTPLLFIVLERLIEPRLPAAARPEDDEITERGTAIIAGHGRFGQVINRVLASNGYETVVLDLEADLVENLRRFGIEVFYGDATRPDLLAAAGLAEAKLLVVAIDDPAQALELIAYARRERPDLHIVARAFDRRHVYELYKSGTDDIVRETFDSAVRAARYSLEALGMHPFDAENATRTFVKLDLQGLRRLAEVYRADVPIAQNAEYVDRVKQIRAEMERVMGTRSRSRHDHTERGWRPPGNTDIPSDLSRDASAAETASGSSPDKAPAPERGAAD